MQLPTRRWEKFQKRDTGPVHITKAGLDRMRERLERLKRGLPELISEAERTAAYGDRSENAEYKDAKGRLRGTHRQIFSIEDQLKRVVLIRPGAGTSGTVQIGSAVVLDTQATGSTSSPHKTFQIVGSHETDPARGRISFSSPLGAALMGRKKGDAVTIKTASGARTYRIIEVR